MQDEIIRMAREAGYPYGERGDGTFKLLSSEEDIVEILERFAALVAAHAKSEQINLAYQQGCEDMKRRMEKRISDLELQIQLCQTAVADEREACAKVCDNFISKGYQHEGELELCAEAIRARGDHAG